MTRGRHKRSLHQVAHTILIDRLLGETSAAASFFKQFQKIIHSYNNLQNRKFITNSSKRQEATNKKRKSNVNNSKPQKRKEMSANERNTLFSEKISNKRAKILYRHIFGHTSAESCENETLFYREIFRSRHITCSHTRRIIALPKV